MRHHRQDRGRYGGCAALCMRWTLHLGEKARADACRALREHEMAALREAADELEELVPQTYWPMPDYCELLFDL